MYNKYTPQQYFVLKLGVCRLIKEKENKMPNEAKKKFSEGKSFTVVGINFERMDNNWFEFYFHDFFSLTHIFVEANQTLNEIIAEFWNKSSKLFRSSRFL